MKQNETLLSMGSVCLSGQGSRPIVLRQIPIPNGQLDLRLQRVPDLPIGLRPGLGLGEALIGLPPMLGIGGGDPC